MKKQTKKCNARECKNRNCKCNSSKSEENNICKDKNMCNSYSKKDK